MLILSFLVSPLCHLTFLYLSGPLISRDNRVFLWKDFRPCNCATALEKKQLSFENSK